MKLPATSIFSRAATISPNSAHPQLANLPDIDVAGKFNPWNINHMPPVEFCTHLELGRNLLLLMGTNYGAVFTDGNLEASVCGMNLAAEKRFMKSWLTLSSR